MAHIYKPLDWEARLGYRVDKTRCRAAVHEAGRRVGFHQCNRNPKVTVDGLGFCNQHSPEAEKVRKSREEEKDRKWRAQFEADNLRHRIVSACLLSKSLPQDIEILVNKLREIGVK